MTEYRIIDGKEILAEYWIGSKEKGGIRFLPSYYGVKIDAFRVGEDCPTQKLSIATEDIGKFVDILNKTRKEWRELIKEGTVLPPEKSFTPWSEIGKEIAEDFYVLCNCGIAYQDKIQECPACGLENNPQNREYIGRLGKEASVKC